MRKKTRYTIIAAFFGINVIAAFAQTLAPQAPNEEQSLFRMVESTGPQAFTFSGGVNRTGWLVVTRHNVKALDKRQGFDPSFTSITCDYKPIVRKQDDGKYEITFTSEIAEKLP